jgi:anthranilate synthase
MQLRYSTPSGIAVTRVVSRVNFKKGLQSLLKDLDTHRGVYLSSGYEFPGRYSRWDFASTRPPLEIVAIDREVEFRPLNLRGEMLNQMLLPILERHSHWDSFGRDGSALRGRLQPLPKLFSEGNAASSPRRFPFFAR